MSAPTFAAGDLAMFAPLTRERSIARAAGLVVVVELIEEGEITTLYRVANIADLAHRVAALSEELTPVTVEPSAFAELALTVTTSHTCPACGQTISAVVGPGNTYTECGGEGEGGCTPWIEGDEPANYAHHLAVTQATAAAEFYRLTR